MKYLSLFILFFFIITSLHAEKIKLPSGTVIPVKCQDRLTGKTVKAGQSIVFYVSQDVKINDKTVIKAGAPVIGIVQESKGSQMAGISGKLTISLQSVTAVDGTNVQLTGQFLSEGSSEVGATIAVSVILCPLALLNKGGQAVIPAGAQTRGIVVGDYFIDVKDDENTKNK